MAPLEATVRTLAATPGAQDVLQVVLRGMRDAAPRGAMFLVRGDGMQTSDGPSEFFSALGFTSRAQRRLAATIFPVPCCALRTALAVGGCVPICSRRGWRVDGSRGRAW